MTLTRYVRAFFQAMAMTLRGEKPPEMPYPAVREWAAQTVVLVDHIVNKADSSGLNQARRQLLTVTVDRRQIDLDKALQIVRQHATHEYPYLLKHHNQYSLMTVQATNINDQYLAQRLVEIAGLPPEVTALLRQLSDHLQALPSESE